LFPLIFFGGMHAAFADLTFTPIYGGGAVDKTLYFAVKYSNVVSGQTNSVDPTKTTASNVNLSDADGGTDSQEAFKANGEFFARAKEGELDFRVLDVGIGKATDTGLADAFKIRFSGTQTYTPASGEQLLLVAYVTSGSQKIYVPISGNHSLCNGNACYSKANDSSGYYFGMPFSGTTLSNIVLAFHPKDICTVTDIDDCTSLSTSQAAIDKSFGESGKSILPAADGVVGGDSSESFEMTVAVVGTTVASTVPDLNNSATKIYESVVLTLNFQSERSAMTCPSAEVMSNVYFPGDSEIHLDTSQFKLQNSTSMAPLGAIVVVATESPTEPDNTKYSSYDASLHYTEVGQSTDVLFGGFENSTASSAKDYNLLFGVKDKAGLVSFVTPTGSLAACTLTGVRASAVQSFLKKSKCFIATASFQSMDAAPVAMLREFRDQILLKSALGKRFVHWYYGWSEPAAGWVLDHPWIRFPVLLMLVPVQASVWFAMNYRAFLGLLLIVTFGAIILHFSLRKPGSESNPEVIE